MPSADAFAKTIWDYMLMHMPPQKCDCIFVLCSNDLRVADYAARLYGDGYGEFLIFSGGYGNFTRNVFSKPEAELFAERAMEQGVPSGKIIVENRAANTGENVSFTLRLLQTLDVRPQSWLLVQKPFMERRSLATFQKQLPDAKAIVTSPPIAYEDYANDAIGWDLLLNTLVGDLQRLIEYPGRGYITPQTVPAEVVRAMEALLKMGYDRHSLPSFSASR